jgi:shikimate kinase
MKLVLIGARAAGKTTVGRAIAARAHVPFADLDDAVRARFGGQSVAQIWSDHGEAAWRKAEGEALEAMLQDHAIGVVALGGGAITAEPVRRALATYAAAGRIKLVYLSCDVHELASRLQADPQGRPSLTGRPISEEVKDVVAARRPLYEQAAHITIDTTSRSLDEVARMTLESVKPWPDQAAR